jgi:hypothetical protein
MRSFFAAPFALLMATSALAQAPAWRVSEASGDVRIIENGRARPAPRGAVVPAGAILATAPGARAVIVRAHDYVVVSPASRVRVPTLQQQGGSGLIQMITDSGTAMFRIQHQQVPHFGVQTPYLAAVVKGTVFTVTVGERGASVQVTEGAVQVSTVDGGAADMIRPGMVATIAAADLRLLHVDGETSRDLRSNGAPSAGVVTVPAAAAGHYDGPAEARSEVAEAVHEDPVSLADATGGLVTGNLGGGERIAADFHEAAREVARGGGQGGNGNGGSGNAGNGNGNSGSGNNNGNGGSGNGSGNAGSGSANSGSGNNSGGGNAGSGNSGSGSGNSGTGSGNSGSGTDNSGSGSSHDGGGDNSGSGSGHDGGGDNGGSGSGHDGGGDNGSGGLNPCAGQAICVGVRHPPHS